jgi:hypothetical protein
VQAIITDLRRDGTLADDGQSLRLGSVR